VITDIRALAEPPDVIHGQHFIPAGEAIIRFPATPAINMVHSATHWVEKPVRFPQVYRHVAVDQACRDRIVHSEGIDPSRVLVLQNAVDLARIPERSEALPERPRRALAFSKTKAEIPLIEAACRRFDITLEVHGFDGSGALMHPEKLFADHDLVFTSARSAIEALCAGAAVIVCDGRGLAGFVGPSDYPRLREHNFGLRSLVNRVTVPNLSAEIARYDAPAARSVSQRARQDAELGPVLDRLLALYEEAIAATAAQPPDLDRHREAVAAYLHDALPRLPSDQRWPFLAEREALLERVANLDRDLAWARKELAAHEADRLARQADRLELEAWKRRRERRRTQNEPSDGSRG
jgi:hypothetical protein